MSSEAQVTHDIGEWLTGVTGSDEFGARPAEERLRIAAACLMVENGVVKTELIAARARMSQSTMFRHVAGRDQLLVESVEWAWEQINHAIGAASFESPVVSNSMDTILNDFDAVLRLYDDGVGRLAATLALGQLRRPQAFGDTPPRSVAQARFFARLDSLCGQIVGAPDASRLSTYIANYTAAIWFSWFIDGPAIRDDDYLLGRDRVGEGLRTHLERVAADAEGARGRRETSH